VAFARAGIESTFDVLDVAVLKFEDVACFGEADSRS
jgi:hypothetical protein